MQRRGSRCHAVTIHLPIVFLRWVQPLMTMTTTTTTLLSMMITTAMTMDIAPLPHSFFHLIVVFLSHHVLTAWVDSILNVSLENFYQLDAQISKGMSHVGAAVSILTPFPHPHP